jgi:hypothetical protein
VCEKAVAGFRFLFSELQSRYGPRRAAADEKVKAASRDSIFYPVNCFASAAGFSIL